LKNESLIPNAQTYASRRQLDLTEKIGSGKEGIGLRLNIELAEQELHPALRRRI
jgi:hypothetical protein